MIRLKKIRVKFKNECQNETIKNRGNLWFKDNDRYCENKASELIKKFYSKWNLIDYTQNKNGKKVATHRSWI